jgi:ATP-dependent helicase HrpA
LQLPSPVRTLDRLLDQQTKLRLVTGPVQSRAQWYNDCIDAAIDAVIANGGGPAWDRAGFERLVDQARDALPESLAQLAAAVERISATVTRLEPMLDERAGSSVEVSVRDARAHFQRLVYPGFVAGVGVDRIDDVARYLEALAYRVESLTDAAARDLQGAAECVEVERRHRELVDRFGLTEDLEAAMWQLEELRVATFAQHLKVPGRISATRVLKRLNEVARAMGPGQPSAGTR